MSEHRKTRVGVIFGGRSGEHEVSLRSAESVIRSLDPRSMTSCRSPLRTKAAGLVPRNAMAMLSPGEAIQAALKPWRTDGSCAGAAAGMAPSMCSFPIVHGTYGEDGTIQGCWNSPASLTSAPESSDPLSGMDKDVMKRLLREAGLPVGDFWVTRARDIESFVRETWSGIAISRVCQAGESWIFCRNHQGAQRRRACRPHSPSRQSSIARSLSRRESMRAKSKSACSAMTIRRLPSRAKSFPHASSTTTRRSMSDDDSRLLIPAPLEPSRSARRRIWPFAAFQALECSGMARVDLFLEKPTGKVSR